MMCGTVSCRWFCHWCHLMSPTDTPAGAASPSTRTWLLPEHKVQVAIGCGGPWLHSRAPGGLDAWGLPPSLRHPRRITALPALHSIALKPYTYIGKGRPGTALHCQHCMTASSSIRHSWHKAACCVWAAVGDILSRSFSIKGLWMPCNPCLPDATRSAPAPLHGRRTAVQTTCHLQAALHGCSPALVYVTGYRHPPTAAQAHIGVVPRNHPVCRRQPPMVGSVCPQ
jgi:hypothetical protein